ncbi:hypothetical protein FIBSPDRAFT_966891 [Athelia psychrophila]|uniref:Uncharacterized protein n=1 Tax=Athelia psychrophila TaxID=1759441 RepID=A0A167WB51_9AGAM|nr:hypothetical protein FIBSPDRAFT_966891 [Fibularhizoctonia sp. CBS 109695]
MSHQESAVAVLEHYRESDHESRRALSSPPPPPPSMAYFLLSTNALTASFSVKNTRVHDGNEVAQVYLGFPRSRASRRGFERGFLRKGQSAQFSIGKGEGYFNLGRDYAEPGDSHWLRDRIYSTIPPAFFNPYGYGSDVAVTPSFNRSSWLEEITSRIVDPATGIELQMYHSDAAPGQHEIVAEPMSPVQAVGALV